jgi:uncharacterized Zn ribbon protein
MIAECIGRRWFEASESSPMAVRDAHGALLADGHSVVLVQDLKSRARLRLIEGDHNIDWKTSGFGAV